MNSCVVSRKHFYSENMSDINILLQHHTCWRIFTLDPEPRQALSGLGNQGALMGSLGFGIRYAVGRFRDITLVRDFTQSRFASQV